MPGFYTVQQPVDPDCCDSDHLRRQRGDPNMTPALRAGGLSRAAAFAVCTAHRMLAAGEGQGVSERERFSELRDGSGEELGSPDQILNVI